MVPLMTTAEQAVYVWGEDPSVGLGRPEWVLESEVGHVVGGDALRLTMRQLDPREMASVLDGDGRFTRHVKSLELCFIEARGPGVPTDRDAFIAALPPRLRHEAGATIFMASLGPPTSPVSSGSPGGAGSAASAAVPIAGNPGGSAASTTQAAPGA